MKPTFKKIILSILQKRVKQFFKNNPDTKLIAVVGSAGKTSTKQAIAVTLSKRYRTISGDSNHSGLISVPLAVLGIPFPETDYTSFKTWFAILKLAKKRSKKHDIDAQVVVIELPTNAPGSLANYQKYLNPDIAVVTAIAADHMDAFGTLEAVAKEQLSIGAFSKAVIVNRDDINEEYAKLLETTDIDTYGLSSVAEFHFQVTNMSERGVMSGSLVTPQFGEQPMQLQVVGEHSIKPIIAAMVVGVRMGLLENELKEAAESIQSLPGRMQSLAGVNGSIIIDDTNSSSPVDCLAAIQTLYNFPSKQRIVVLGSMNEMGNYTKDAHEQVAYACDPSILEWVVTIGEDAEKYLAPAAHLRGCQVRSFRSPIEAGAFVHSVIKQDGVVLIKGSQNGVFAEEAVKTLLEHSVDESKLVRQSVEWMDIKNQFLSKF